MLCNVYTDWSHSISSPFTLCLSPGFVVVGVSGMASNRADGLHAGEPFNDDKQRRKCHHTLSTWAEGPVRQPARSPAHCTTANTTDTLQPDHWRTDFLKSPVTPFFPTVLLEKSWDLIWKLFCSAHRRSSGDTKTWSAQPRPRWESDSDLRAIAAPSPSDCCSLLHTPWQALTAQAGRWWKEHAYSRMPFSTDL